MMLWKQSSPTPPRTSGLESHWRIGCAYHMDDIVGTVARARVWEQAADRACKDRGTQMREANGGINRRNQRQQHDTSMSPSKSGFALRYVAPGTSACQRRTGSVAARFARCAGVKLPHASHIAAFCPTPPSHYSLPPSPLYYVRHQPQVRQNVCGELLADRSRRRRLRQGAREWATPTNSRCRRVYPRSCPW